MVRCSIYVNTDRGELDVVKEGRTSYEYSALKITRVGLRVERGSEREERVRTIPVLTIEQLVRDIESYLRGEVKGCSKKILLFIDDKLVKSKDVVKSVVERFDYVTIRSILVKYLRPSVIIVYGSKAGRFKLPKGKGVMYRKILVPVEYTRDFPVEIPPSIRTASNIVIKASRVSRNRYLLRVKADGRKYRLARPVDSRALYITISAIISRARTLKWVEVEII